MKKNILAFLLLLGCAVSQAQVGVGVANPHASSAFEVKSTTKGFLPPRLTTVQRDAIAVLPALPATGLMIYNTDNKIFEWFDGAVWQGVGSKTLYLADGTLTGARTVTQNNNDLTFVTGTAKTIVDGSFQTKGGVYANVRTVTSLPIVWVDTDYMIIVKLSGVQNLILPNPTLYPGRVICIRNASVAAGTSGTYTYITNVPQDVTTVTANRGQTFVSEGGKWFLISGI